MIGKIAHFRSPALQHRLGHIIERRQRAHIVPLPALRTQHAFFADMIARVVEYRPNIPVSGGFALADAVQHSKVQLVERLCRLGRTGARESAHTLTGGFAIRVSGSRLRRMASHTKGGSAANMRTAQNSSAISGMNSGCSTPSIAAHSPPPSAQTENQPRPLS